MVKTQTSLTMKEHIKLALHEIKRVKIAGDLAGILAYLSSAQYQLELAKIAAANPPKH